MCIFVLWLFIEKQQNNTDQPYTTGNNAIFIESGMSSNIKHNEKHKKVKEHYINTGESFTFFNNQKHDNIDSYASTENTAHNKYEMSCCQENRVKHKKKSTNFSVNDENRFHEEKGINYNSSHSIEPFTVFNEFEINSCYNYKQRKNKNHFIAAEHCTEIDKPKIIYQKHKKKKHKREKIDLHDADKNYSINTVETCTFDDQGVSLQELSQHGDKNYTHSSETYTNFEKFQINSGDKYKYGKKYKKNKESSLSEANRSEISLRKRKKEKKRISYDTEASKNYTVPVIISDYKQKKKHKKDKERDTNIAESNINFDKSEILYKKHKNKYKTDENYTEPVIISDYKQKKKDKERDTNIAESNIYFDKSEILHKKQKNKYKADENDSYIFEPCELNNLEIRSNIQSKHIDEESHFDNVVFNESAMENTKKGKKRKKDKEHNLNISVNCDHISVLNSYYKNDNKYLGSTFTNNTSNNCKINPSDKEYIDNNKHKGDKGNYPYTAENSITFDRPETLIKKCEMKQKRDNNDLHISKSCDNLDKLEISCNMEQINVHEESHFTNIIFDEPAMQNTKKRKKHKNYKDKYPNYILVNDDPKDSALNSCYKNDEEYLVSTLTNNTFNNCERILGHKDKKKHKRVKENVNNFQERNERESALDVHEVNSKNYPEIPISTVRTASNSDNPELNIAELGITDFLVDETCLSAVNGCRRDKENDNLISDTYNYFNNSESSYSDKPGNKHKGSTDLNRIDAVDHDNIHNYHQQPSNTMEATNSIDYRNKCKEKFIEKSKITCEAENASSDEDINDLFYPRHLDNNEDPVDFDVPFLHSFEKICVFNQKEKDLIKVEGIVIKRGTYTAAEDKIIKRNFEDFVKRYGISDPAELLGIGRYEIDRQLLKFLRAKHFYIRLAKDLNNRTLHSVYRRARIILNPYRNSGRFTEREITNLKELCKSVTSKWHQIGDTLGKPGEKCLNTFRCHEKDVAKGEFTEAEEMQLVEAIKNITGNSDLTCKNLQGISWETIASHVPTRNLFQCRAYWATHLAWKPGKKRKKWDYNCYCKLVQILKDLNVEESSRIDWYKVFESFEDFAPSHLYVQKRWYYMRARIPDYKNKSFREIIKSLCKMYPQTHENNK